MTRAICCCIVLLLTCGPAALPLQAWEPIQSVEQHAAFLRKDFPALPPEWIPEVGGGRWWVSRCRLARQFRMHCWRHEVGEKACESGRQQVVRHGLPTIQTLNNSPPLAAIPLHAPMQMAAQLAAFPLAVAGMRVHASQLHAPGGLVLIGDAAHGVTPRTGV